MMKSPGRVVPANPQSIASVVVLEPRRHYSASTVIKGFTTTNLVSDGAISAKFTDANLKNAWGLAMNTQAGVIWTSDEASGLSSVYNLDGSPAQTGLYNTIAIPAASGNGAGGPTGIVFNTTRHFLVHEGSSSAPAAYLWATVNGTIAAWNPSVDAISARNVVNQSSSHAEFTGLALASTPAGDRIFAADFHNGKVVEFDNKYALVSTTNPFVDPKIPSGFAPFNVANIGGKIYVTYAKQDSNAQREVNAVGNGFVDVFSTSGVLLEHLATGGLLNSPWAVVQAPKTFGKLGGDVLIGNFGDGKILAFNPAAPAASRAVGVMGTAAGHTLSVDGLWGMSFGDTATTADSLFVLAGPNGEQDGLLAVINA